MKAPNSKPRASVQNDVMADVNQVWRKFTELHSARLALSWKGKGSFDESEELGYLVARGLDALDMPVMWKYTGSDPYQRDVFLSHGRINFGNVKASDSLSDYLLLNELLTWQLREMMRHPYNLAAIREATSDDVDFRLWVRLVFSEIARLATTLSAGR